MTNKHPHAELMAMYAKDAMHSKTPWIYWESDEHRDYYTLNNHPNWDTRFNLRRRASAPEWDAEKFVAGRELTFVEAAEYVSYTGKTNGLQMYIDGVGWVSIRTKHRIAPIKKKMIIVNGVEVPMHETEELKIDTTYFVPSLSDLSIRRMKWVGDVLDKFNIEQTLVYLNRGDAQARLDAMLKYEEVQS